jgi:hypothetical protein
MTDLQIDTSRMPVQSWKMAVQPLPQSRMASPSLTEARPVAPRSQRVDEANARSTAVSLQEQLFDSSAKLKVTFSQIAMHLTPSWRNTIFEQLDSLLNVEDWQDDSALIDDSSFSTFLRFLIYAAPNRLPSLGVGPTGHVLAAWGEDAQRIAIEFLPKDSAMATMVKQGTRGKETVAWRGHVVDLKLFIERFGASECMNGEAA